MKSVNGEYKNCSRVVPQEESGMGIMSTYAEEGSPVPPVAKNGRFSEFFLDDDVQKNDKYPY